MNNENTEKLVDMLDSIDSAIKDISWVMRRKFIEVHLAVDGTKVIVNTSHILYISQKENEDTLIFLNYCDTPLAVAEKYDTILKLVDVRRLFMPK